MIESLLRQTFQEAITSAIPESTLTVSKWAETYRFVPEERVANPSLAGKWRNDTTPYLVGIMDAVTDQTVNEVLFLGSSQIGKTESINNILGYFIHADPSTILFVSENEDKASSWSVECLAPMIRDTPVLSAIFGEAKSRDSSNTIQGKAFRGGHFALAWATSPATLSSRPRRVVVTDETWAFQGTKEGDPLTLAEARTKTAKEQRKIVHVTTPRDKFTGGTNKDQTPELHPMMIRWENSTQERFFVPCPECGEFQILEWSRIKWDSPEDAGAAYCVCVNGCVIENVFPEDKYDWLSRGEWRSLNPDYKGNRRAFWLNELYSPFTTWGEMAVAFLEAKKFKDTLKAFINTRLGEPWEEKPIEIAFADLNFHREEYEAEVPRGVSVITAGVDVQDDRLEVEVVGWGRDFESWSIDYHVIYGSPSLPDVWHSLSDYLLRDWLDADNNAHRIRAACVDSGGHHTDQVYRFAKANAGRRWFAVKGANISGKPLVSKPTIVGRNKVKLFTVGTDVAKDEIFSFLRVEEQGPGFCHFPDADKYDERYFKMLCAETKQTKYIQGVARQQYVKVSTAARNEALDCRVYATAARAILNPKLKSAPDYVPKQAETAPITGETAQNDAETPQNAPNLTPKRPIYKRFAAKSAANWR